MLYEVRNNLDKGYFKLIKTNVNGVEMEYILEKYNIDLNDYYIIKGTRSFKILNVDNIPNYAGVICFNRSMYRIQYINKWFNFFKSIGNPIPYLDKPFPPKYMLNKIKVVQ